MKIYLPHLHYTVVVRKFKKAPPQLPNAKAFARSDNRNQCTIFIPLKGKIPPGDLAHELVHVLQFICLNRNMNFTLEHEHTAYIMHYLMGKILGYSWED